MLSRDRSSSEKVKVRAGGQGQVTGVRGRMRSRFFSHQETLKEEETAKVKAAQAAAKVKGQGAKVKTGDKEVKDVKASAAKVKEFTDNEERSGSCLLLLFCFGCSHCCCL